MLEAGRRRRRLAPLALGLALWSGLPSFEWCPFTWEDCWKACETALAEPSGAAACEKVAEGGGEAACDAVAAPQCRAASAARCGATGGLCVLPCDADPDPIPFGDRAWCVHAPIEAVPVRGVELPPVDAGPVLFVVPEAPTLALPAGAERERAEVASACPALHAPHAPPQSRAPPSA